MRCCQRTEKPSKTVGIHEACGVVGGFCRVVLGGAGHGNPVVMRSVDEGRDWEDAHEQGGDGGFPKAAVGICQ